MSQQADVIGGRLPVSEPGSVGDRLCITATEFNRAQVRGGVAAPAQKERRHAVERRARPSHTMPLRNGGSWRRAARFLRADAVLKRMDRHGGGRVKLGGGNAHERAVAVR